MKYFGGLPHSIATLNQVQGKYSIPPRQDYLQMLFNFKDLFLYLKNFNLTHFYNRT